MKTTLSAWLAAIAGAVAISSAQKCGTPAYGGCGNAAQGLQCCPTNQYCVPWSATFYGCQDLPPLCPVQAPNVLVAGADRMQVPAQQPGECCAACVAKPDCKVYSFVNNHPGGPACFLSGLGDLRDGPGAVTGYVMARIH